MFKRWKWIMGRRICRIIWWILKRRSKIPHSTSQANKIKIRYSVILRRVKPKNNVWKCIKCSIRISRMLSWTNSATSPGMASPKHFPNIDVKLGSCCMIIFPLIRNFATKCSPENETNIFKLLRIILETFPTKPFKIYWIKITRIRKAMHGFSCRILRRGI